MASRSQHGAQTKRCCAFCAKLPSDGYFELWVRATDANGLAQPLVAPNWNPQGYCGNPINRVAVLVDNAEGAREREPGPVAR